MSSAVYRLWEKPLSASECQQVDAIRDRRNAYLITNNACYSQN